MLDYVVLVAIAHRHSVQELTASPDVNRAPEQQSGIRGRTHYARYRSIPIKAELPRHKFLFPCFLDSLNSEI
jgi:hypothetical protein